MILWLLADSATANDLVAANGRVVSNESSQSLRPSTEFAANTLTDAQTQVRDGVVVLRVPTPHKEPTATANRSDPPAVCT